MIEFDRTAIEHLVKNALAEDVGAGDITSDALIAPDRLATARVEVKEAGILCGLIPARLAFELTDSRTEFRADLTDGSPVEPEEEIARITGPARGIMAAERVALNFLQHLSGIATFTRRFVERVKKYPVKIMDTRKTTPGLRILEKYAVRMGGGYNHRLGLFDEILIKDNHLALAGGVGSAVLAAKRHFPNRAIEVEITGLPEVEVALRAGADILLFDNMEITQLMQSVKAVRGWNQSLKAGVPKVITEASGGVTLEQVEAIAETGVDLISVGALTHSVKALDISLEIMTG